MEPNRGLDKPLYKPKNPFVWYVCDKQCHVFLYLNEVDADDCTIVALGVVGLIILAEEATDDTEFLMALFAVVVGFSWYLH